MCHCDGRRGSSRGLSQAFPGGILESSATKTGVCAEIRTHGLTNMKHDCVHQITCGTEPQGFRLGIQRHCIRSRSRGACRLRLVRSVPTADMNVWVCLCCNVVCTERSCDESILRQVVIFIYSFLFNNAVSSTDCIGSNDWVAEKVRVEAAVAAL